MWARITIVLSHLADTVEAAALILVAISNVLAILIATPRSNAVNRLDTQIGGALLKLVGVWAGVTAVGSGNRDLVESAPLVVVGFTVVEHSAYSSQAPTQSTGCAQSTVVH